VTKHKYLRHSVRGFILWPSDHEMFHSHVAQTLERQYQAGSIVSAGFAFISQSGVTCMGESESLGLKSLPEDTDLLALQLGIPAAPPVVQHPPSLRAL
jgi:hypothetical protein